MIDEILTFEEARRYLKFGKSKLYHLAKQKKIPVSKIGRTWRFRKDKLIAWLDKQENVR